MQDGWTPLYAAAFDGHVDAIIALLDHGADISATDKVRYSYILAVTVFYCHNATMVEQHATTRSLTSSHHNQVYHLCNGCLTCSCLYTSLELLYS